MPKRIGFLYEKMADKGFIRRVILEASRGKRKRREVRRVLKNLDEYVDKTYDMIVSESFVPTRRKSGKSTTTAARSGASSRSSLSGRTA